MFLHQSNHSNNRVLLHLPVLSLTRQLNTYRTPLKLYNLNWHCCHIKPRLFLLLLILYPQPRHLLHPFYLIHTHNLHRLLITKLTLGSTQLLRLTFYQFLFCILHQSPLHNPWLTSSPPTTSTPSIVPQVFASDQIDILTGTTTQNSDSTNINAD